MKAAAPVFVPATPGATRRVVARWLTRTGEVLAAAARHLGSAPAPRRGEPVLEFYAEAGAPEGALYVDGELVGWVSGVTRL